MSNESLDRRDFLKSVGALSAATTAMGAAKSSSKASGRVIGANDRINIGLIGCGGRGDSDAMDFTAYGKKYNDACQIAAVCDVYTKRTKRQADRYKAKAYSDYRELLNQSDIDAVIIATPDHWHAKMAMDAMDHGKHVYLEKPMGHTN